MPWLDQLKREHSARINENLWRERKILESPQGREVSVDGRSYLNFCSNDYLGLANHPQLVSAAAAALQASGTGSGASHLVCGHMEQHHSLEQEIARFVGAEKAIVFSTGYMANLAIPQTFLGRNDLIIEDRLNHASLIDAGRFCPAEMKRYPHLDWRAAEKLLSQSRANRKLVTTDGVFSMDGDIAPVTQLQEACAQQDALLLVDDAHGFGVLGNTGIGTLEESGIQIGGGVLLLGTLGKSAGSFGAFVAGDAIYIESLVQFARPYIYTTALPPSVVAASRTAIQIIQTEPQRRQSLKRNIEYFRRAIENSCLDLANSTTPIQPLILKSSDAALRAAQHLKQNGILVTAIRPPTVPVGTARLRITLSAAHTTEDIDRLADSLTSTAMVQIVGGDA